MVCRQVWLRLVDVLAAAFRGVLFMCLLSIVS